MMWRDNGLNQMALTGVTMSNPDRPLYDGREHNGAAINGFSTTTRATVDQFEPIAPRTRVNVKKLANGQWQPDITIESYDADPLTVEGRDRIRGRMFATFEVVSDVIETWEGDADG